MNISKLVASGMKLRLSERALGHFREIGATPLAEFGSRKWLVYSAQLEQGFSTLRRFPGIELRPSELEEGVHVFRVRAHWICYEIMGDTLLVHAILRHLDDFSEDPRY